MPDRLKRQKFIFLAVLFGLLFLFPLISIADKPARAGGIPVLFLYFFMVWLISIVLLYRHAESRNHPPQRHE